MTVDKPAQGQIPQLRSLWQQAFGDSDAFLDGFFATGFSENRCMCITWNETVVAALYWFDCLWNGSKLGYIYAVATDKTFQGKGFCRKLMEMTHRHLKNEGYVGATLVPGSRALFSMYEKMGYRGFSPKQIKEVAAAQTPVAIHTLTPEDYAQRRKKILPPGGVVQDGAALDYLATYAGFYEADGCLFCGGGEDVFQFQEFLGEEEKLPGILAGLQTGLGRVPCPGDGLDSAMFIPLTDSPEMPMYFGLPLN